MTCITANLNVVYPFMKHTASACLVQGNCGTEGKKNKAITTCLLPASVVDSESGKFNSNS